jgi:cohesin loading factor subunit SCC2
LRGAFDAILSHILIASELPTATFRTKALRALGLIVEQDADIFFLPNARKTIESRLLDSSPAVRDAALDMLGKYVLINPQLAVEYLPRILDRITVELAFYISAPLNSESDLWYRTRD